jgi:hypothetical protein
MNYLRFLSHRGRRLQPSAIRALQPLVSLPGMISLGGGYPNSRLFPFQSLSMRLAQPGSECETESTEVTLSTEQLSTALQYSPSYGIPSLLDKLSIMQTVRENCTPCLRVPATNVMLDMFLARSAYPTRPLCYVPCHSESTLRHRNSRFSYQQAHKILWPKYVVTDSDVVAALYYKPSLIVCRWHETCWLASLAKTFDLLLDEGDTVLTENPTYSGALSALRPINCRIHGTDGCLFV